MLSKTDLFNFDALHVPKMHACVGRQEKRAQRDAQVMRAVGCTNFTLLKSWLCAGAGSGCVRHMLAICILWRSAGAWLGTGPMHTC